MRLVRPVKSGEITSGYIIFSIVQEKGNMDLYVVGERDAHLKGLNEEHFQQLKTNLESRWWVHSLAGLPKLRTQELAIT